MSATAQQAPSIGQIKNKSYYQGTIKDQQMIWMGKEGEQYPALVLTVGLTGELLDTYKPERGVQACPQIDVDVYLMFNESNTQGAEIAADTLHRLGFTGDTEELNPASDKHHSFIGQTVYVTPSFTMRNDREKIYWNFRFPRSAENSKLGKGEFSKSPGGQLFRELLAERRAAGNNSPF